MKLTIKSLALASILCLAFSNYASADFHFNDPNFGTLGGNNGHDNQWNNRDHGDHHWGNGNGNWNNGGNGGIGHRGRGVTPEPVGYLLFLLGAGVLALSYRKRYNLPTA